MKYAIFSSQGGNRDGVARYFEAFVYSEAAAKLEIRRLFQDKNRFGRDWAFITTGEEMTSIRGSGDVTDSSDTGWHIVEYVPVHSDAYYDASTGKIVDPTDIP